MLELGSIKTTNPNIHCPLQMQGIGPELPQGREVFAKETDREIFSCQNQIISAAASLRPLERPSRHSFENAPCLVRNYLGFADGKYFSISFQ